MAEAVAAPRFEMRGVGKAFGATVALDAVDFAARSGEVCALVGQNGAGKSTLMAILSGAIRPDQGALWLDGAPYAPRDPVRVGSAVLGAASCRFGAAAVHDDYELRCLV